MFTRRDFSWFTHFYFKVLKGTCYSRLNEVGINVINVNVSKLVFLSRFTGNYVEANQSSEH